MSSSAGGREVHLVGSVPLLSSDAVFRAAGSILEGRIRKIPDGETGRRKNWINFQYAVLAAHPALEFDGPPVDLDAFLGESDGQGADYAFTRLRLRADVGFEGHPLGELGYAAHARESYAAFAELKRQGAIGADMRFQVSLPTPLAPVAIFVAPEHIFAVYPHYAAALFRELGQILAEIPHTELAIQWDVAIEVGLWEGLFPPPPGDWRTMLLDGLARLGAPIPAEVWLGYHLCYGDRGHQHFVEPADTANLTEIANGLFARAPRRIDWIHMPVPRDRDDAAYFAPLRGLKRPEGTKLFLGLVHRSDGEEGARRRIAAAETVVTDFGIGTECGLGRRAPDTILDLLALHAAVL